MKLLPVALTLETNHAVVRYLDELVATGLFGRSREEAAESVLCERLRELIADGTLERRRAP